jgi:hypothetical protein
MDKWTNPPATCPRETESDEQMATPIGAAGIEVESAETRRRVLVMWETAQDVAKANDFTVDAIHDPLLSLFESRSSLITNDAELQKAREAVARLIVTTIAGARERGFNVLNEFFLNEALFKMPRVFPLTN